MYPMILISLRQKVAGGSRYAWLLVGANRDSKNGGVMCACVGGGGGGEQEGL